MKYYICRFKKYDTKEGIIISVCKKGFFVFNKITTVTCTDCNRDKDGMNNCSYTVNTVVLLMKMLMVFCNLICLSDRTTHVNCSIIIIKTNTNTLHFITIHFSNLSHTCCGHSASHHQRDRLMKIFI